MKIGIITYAVDLASAGIEKAQIVKAQAEKALAQMTCTAPEDGRIVRSFVSEGSPFGPATREPARPVPAQT